MAPEKCPKCGGAIEPGYLLEHGEANIRMRPLWVRGAPVRAFFTRFKVARHDKMAITTYRCTKCGYLESYATGSEPPPSEW